MYAMDASPSPIPHVFRVSLSAYKNILTEHKNQVGTRDVI